MSNSCELQFSEQHLSRTVANNCVKHLLTICFDLSCLKLGGCGLTGGRINESAQLELGLGGFLFCFNTP